MSLIILVFIAIFTMPHESRAQWDARSIALGNALLQLPGKVLVGPQNPAGLAWLRSAEGVLSIMPAPYGVPILRRFGASVGIPLSVLTSSISITGMGGELARRFEVRGSVGFLTTENMGFGASLIAEQWTFARYGSRRTLCVDVGAMMRTEELSIGARSLLRAVEPRGGGLLESMTLGAAVHPSGRITLLAEAEQADLFPLGLRYGVIYCPVEPLALYTGWSEVPDLLSGGVSVTFEGWEVIYGGQWHAELGWFHAVGIARRIKE